MSPSDSDPLPLYLPTLSEAVERALAQMHGLPPPNPVRVPKAVQEIRKARMRREIRAQKVAARLMKRKLKTKERREKRMRGPTPRAKFREWKHGKDCEMTFAEWFEVVGRKVPNRRYGLWNVPTKYAMRLARVDPKKPWSLDNLYEGVRVGKMLFRWEMLEKVDGWDEIVNKTLPDKTQSVTNTSEA